MKARLPRTVVSSPTSRAYAALRQMSSLAALSLLPAAASVHAATPDDWAQIGRYRSANAAISAIASTQPRVVFMGDSILEGWGRLDPAFFAAEGRINRAISGQTTSQMLVRFRSDVIVLRPKAVVILAGTNDIAGNTGPITNAEIVGQIATMAELARIHGIRVVLVSVLPAERFAWNPAVKPAARIAELNQMLSSYAKQQGVAWVDLYGVLADEKGGLPRRFSDDGVHPTPAAYQVMRPLLEEAIAAALR